MALTETTGIAPEDEKEILTDNSPSKEEKSLEEEIKPNNEDVFDGDIDLSITRKKRFRINGDNNTVLELNTSDMSVINRLQNIYPRLQELSQDASVKKLTQEESDDDKTIEKISKSLTKIDMTMRQLIDEIFDSNVCEVCAPSGSMIEIGRAHV
mgnify:CR=1 FL=1